MPLIRAVHLWHLSSDHITQHWITKFNRICLVGTMNVCWKIRWLCISNISCLIPVLPYIQTCSWNDLGTIFSGKKILNQPFKMFPWDLRNSRGAFCRERLQLKEGFGKALIRAEKERMLLSALDMSVATASKHVGIFCSCYETLWNSCLLNVCAGSSGVWLSTS